MTTAADHFPDVWDLLRGRGSAHMPDAGAGDTIQVDDAGLIFRGDYVRDGADLVVSGNGQRLVVHDYFTAAHRPKLVAPNGASLSDSVIEALARPLHGVQVAQAGDPAASDATKAIGRVQSLTGTASVVRNGVTVAIHTGDLVYKGDVLQTDRASGLSVSFLDGTLFSLAAGARMVMTEMVYQAGGTGNHSLFNLVQGSISFVAGQVAKTGDMKVGTPVATMGIRGTAVQATVQSDDGTSRLSVMTEPPSPEHPDGHTGRFDVYDTDDPGILLFTVSDPNIVAVVHPKGTGDVRVDQVPKTPADIAYETALVRTLYQGQADAPRLPIYTGPSTGGGTSSGTPPNQVLPDQAPTAPSPGAPGTQGPVQTGPGSGTPDGVQGPGRQPDAPPPSGDVPRTDAVPNAAPGITGAASPALPAVAVAPAPAVSAPAVPTAPTLTPPAPADPAPPAAPAPVVAFVAPVPPVATLALAASVVSVAEGGVVTVADAAHGLLAGDGAGVTITGAHAGSGADAGVTGGSVTVVGRYGTLTLHADGTYVYVADHAASLAPGQQVADVFGFSAQSGGATATATLTVAVTGTNDPPVSGGSHAIGVVAGGTAVVRAAILAASDPDNAPDQLTYTITSQPHGYFTDSSGNATTTFTQAQVDAGTITYHHDGTATGGSDVAFTLTDAAGASVGGTLAVAVAPAAGGRVVDGYIAGALVFADANGNGLLDAGEVSAYSGADGSFSLVGGSGRLVATGGTDISTGLPNVLTLIAPAGSAIIDPLTTLVQDLGGSGAANAQVAAAFGLPSGTDLSSLDPVAAAASGSASGRSAYLANVAVADTTALLSAALIGQGVSPDAAYAALLDQIAGLVGSLGAGATLDLSSAATGQSLLAGAAAALQISLTPQAAATVAAAAGASNTLLYGAPGPNQSLFDHVAATAQAARAQAASLETLLTPPRLVAQTHPVVAQGGSVVLTRDNLLATDPTDAAGAITYTVTDDPHGSFSLGSTVNGTVHLTPVTHFTQADVDAGAVVYRHDDTVPAGGFERVAFTLSDAAGGSAAGHLDIAVDARPVITTGGDAAATIAAIPITGNATPQSQVGQGDLTAGHNLVNTLGGPAGFGTTVLAVGDDNSSGAIDITGVFGAQGLNFFGTYYTSLYVNNNGNITFGGPSSTFTPSQITSSSAAIIAPFFADVDTRGGATSPTPGGTSTGSDRVYISADSVNGVFTVTWDDVGYYSQHTDHPNAFQVQLVGLGGGDFDIVYRYEAVNWTVGDASGGVNAVVGYAAGNGANFYELPQSGHVAPLQALPATLGNTGLAGVYVFQASGGTVNPNATLRTTGTIGFTDTEAGDTHTASSSLDHLSLTTARGLEIPADTAAALQAALTAQVTQDGGTAGTVTWSFALANGAAAFLRAGESLTATYDIAVGDGLAASAPTTVTVTIDGVNDPPTVGGDRAIGVPQGGTTVVHTADLGATDPDDGAGQLTYTITGDPHGTFTDAGGTATTQFTQAQVDAGQVVYHRDGTAPTGAPETVSFILTDGSGGSAAGTLAVSVTAPNVAPVVAPAPALALTEAPGQSGGGGLDQAAGQTGFSDANPADLHTVAVTGAPTVSLSSGAAAPAGLAAALTGALSASLDEAGHQVDYSFAAADRSFDALGAHETFTLTYDLAVSDDHGGTAHVPVTVTVAGANDTPVVTAVAGDSAGTATPLVVQTSPGAAGPSASGTLTVTDPDLGDTVTVTGALLGHTGPTGGLSDAQLASYFHTGPAAVTGGGTAHDLTWSFDAAGQGFQFLSHGETLVLSYGVHADDGSGAANGTGDGVVTIAITGPDGLPQLQSAAPGGVQAAVPTRGVTDLTQRQLDAIVAAAIGDWAAAGATAAEIALLAAATYVVADLPGTALGEETAGHVTIDADAAGLGWYVDPIPGDDGAFTHAANAAGTDLFTDPALAPAGHYDLLTTVLHEMGHVLGLPDSTAPAAANDLMALTLATGERRLPAAADVAAATAATAASAATVGRHAGSAPAASGAGHAGSGAPAADSAGATPAAPPAVDPDHAVVASAPDAGTATPAADPAPSPAAPAIPVTATPVAATSVAMGPTTAAAADPVQSAPVPQAVDHTDHAAPGPAPPAQGATASAGGGDHPASADTGAHGAAPAGATAPAGGQTTSGTDPATPAGAGTAAASHDATGQTAATSASGTDHAAGGAATGQGAAAPGASAPASAADHPATGQGSSTAGGGAAADPGHASPQDAATSAVQAEVAHMATTHDVFVFSQPSAAGSSAGVQAIHHFAPASDSLDLSFLPDAAAQSIGDYVHLQASAGGGYDLSVRSSATSGFVTVGHFDAGTLHDGDHVSVSVHDHVAQVVALQLHTS